MISRTLYLDALEENLEKLTAEPQSGKSVLSAVRFIRRENDRKFGCVITQPSLALVVSGSKKALVGDAFFTYGPGTFLLTGSCVPDSFEATDATAEHPFLAISVSIESQYCDWAAARLAEKGLHTQSNEGAKIFSLYPADSGLLGAFLRLTELALDPMLALTMEDLVKKEIYLQVLTSPLGSLFKEFYISGTVENKIRQAADWLFAHFRQNIDHSSLAERVSMSPASYYREFKKIVGVTPGQYVRNLRLTEAKRLMIDEKMDAATACFRVGYESPSYFSREFKNLFGASPAKHVRQIQAELSKATREPRKSLF